MIYKLIIDNKRLFLNLFIFFIIVLVLAIWSSSLLIEWGSDYGTYYSGSYFLNENYILYKEYFDHKGPLYYFFLKMIGYVIGWGHWQSYFSLFLTMLVFYLPIFYILISERLKPMKLIMGTLLSLCILYGQPTNASISFFQSGFLLTSFWILAKYRESFLFQSFSFFLFICAILTRIDAIVFFPVYILALIVSGKHNLFIYLKKIVIWAFILMFTFWSLSSFFNFSIYDYLILNTDFNKWYHESMTASSSLFYKISKFIIRPTSFQLFTSSLMVIPIIILSNQIVKSSSEILNFLKDILKNKINKVSISLNSFVLLFVYFGLASWLFTSSDKNYHFLIFVVPLFLFYLVNLHTFNPTLSISICIIAAYSLITILYLPLYKLHKDPDCIKTQFCQTSSLSLYSDSINFLRNLPDEEIIILGGKGWFYIYSDKKPMLSISNFWFYYVDDPFSSISLLQQHQKILQMPSGFKFLINNEILDKNTKNKFLEEVLSKSKLVNRYFEYTIYEII